MGVINIWPFDNKKCPSAAETNPEVIEKHETGSTWNPFKLYPSIQIGLAAYNILGFGKLMVESYNLLLILVQPMVR